MDDQIDTQFYLRNASQSLHEDSGFNFELMFVTGMLVLTSTAGGEIRALGSHPLRGSLANVIGVGPGKSWLFGDDRAFNAFSLEDEGHEHGFAVPGLVGGQPRQTVAAINEFFDTKKQAMILSSGTRPWGKTYFCPGYGPGMGASSGSQISRTWICVSAAPLEKIARQPFITRYVTLARQSPECPPTI